MCSYQFDQLNTFYEKSNKCCRDYRKTKTSKFLPGDPVVRTTMFMIFSSEGRSMTRGVSRPFEPAHAHSVMPKTLFASPSAAAKSLLRLNTDCPSNSNVLHWSGLKFP